MDSQTNPHIETQETQDQDRMNPQSSLIMIQQNQIQDPQGSFITSISFGPSGLATHCISMS